MDNSKERTHLPMPELLTRASCIKRLEEDLYLIAPRVSPTNQPVKGLSQLNYTDCHLRKIVDKLLSPVTAASMGD